MKKIYVLAAAALFTAGAYAQNSLRVALNKGTSKTSVKADVSKKAAHGGNNTVSAVTGSLMSLNDYVPGSTMDLNFTLELTNMDAEYGDLLEITLPAGFTINSATPSDSLGVAEDPTDQSGCGLGDLSGTKEPFNGISGQMVSWGNNDNCYGGISTLQYGGSWNITINVTIDALVSGNQTANVFVSGDGYGPSPADLTTTTVIKQQQNNNATVLLAYMVGTQNKSGCGLTTDYLALFVKNTGTTSSITIPTVGDSIRVDVDGTVYSEALAYATDITGQNLVSTVAPGDTAIFWFANQVDLSMPGHTYTIAASIDLQGSGDGNSVDDAAAPIVITHIAPQDVFVTAYETNFDTQGDFDLWKGEDVDGGGNSIFYSQSASNHNSSPGALWFFENNTAAASEDWAFSSCFDVTTGNNYYVRFWNRLTSGYAGDLELNLNSDRTSASVVQNIKPSTPLTSDSQWYMDSIYFASTYTGTVYLAFHTTQADPAGTLSIRIDDLIFGSDGTNVGIAKSNATKVELYPNPSKGMLTVNAAANTSIEVVSVLGTSVYKTEVAAGKTELNLSGLANGTYVVKINDGKSATTQKLVINK